MKIQPITTVEQLEEHLSRPTDQVVQMFEQLPGDLIVLGAGGKMGPTLARMARRAADQAKSPRRVLAVSRFNQAAERAKLESWGIQTLAGDLLDERFVASLPEAALVVFMAGMKFGATGNESLTWAMNTLLPAGVCRRYASSRIAVFSTGNVYGLTPVVLGGSVETDRPDPQGEYAMSCLGRERSFEHFSRTRGTMVSILRLNYAVELRYGVLVDLALKIHAARPVDLTMPMVNVIWQRDANTMALLSLQHAASPPLVVNIAGPEQMSIRRASLRLGELLGKPVTFSGTESDRAILSNGQKGVRLFGYPTMGVDELMEHIARWIEAGGQTLGKPTKFEVRDGRF